VRIRITGHPPVVGATPDGAPGVARDGMNSFASQNPTSSAEPENAIPSTISPINDNPTTLTTREYPQTVETSVERILLC